MSDQASKPRKSYGPCEKCGVTSWLVWSDFRKCSECDSTHVIEHSAFEAQAQQLAELKSKLAHRHIIGKVYEVSAESINQLAGELDDAKKELASLRAALDLEQQAHVETAARLRNERDEARKIAEFLASERERLQTAAIEWTRKYAVAADKCDEPNAEIDRLKAEYTTLTMIHSQKLGDKDKLIHELNAELEALTSENEKLKSEHAGLAKLYKRANYDVGNLLDERDELKSKLEAAEKEIERLSGIDKCPACGEQTYRLPHEHVSVDVVKALQVEVERLNKWGREKFAENVELRKLNNRYRTALEKIKNNTVPGGHDQNIARAALADAPETGPSKDELTTKQAVEKLTKELKADPGFFLAWQANIAMAFKDEMNRQSYPSDRDSVHHVANQAAINFLNLLCMDNEAAKGTV